ncbi:NACHT domain-containing protein [Actinomadura fibrosa]|uniref:NACHT domain-containing protein n=1 Tax=Actinomadura fibrosa TaxID=111802 RepID=A0ABW2XTP3_9ACTN|nr:NACHT domain-containing protein [Actinomadura fibrosa]
MATPDETRPAADGKGGGQGDRPADPKPADPKPGALPKIAWLLAVLVPPSALAGFWRDVVRDHAVLAVVLLAVYWALLTAGRFAAGFVRDLVTRRRAGWLDSADRALSLRFTRFRDKYLENLAGSLRYIDQKGLATVGFYAPELDEVFVDVSLAMRAPGLIQGDVLSGASGERPGGGHEPGPPESAERRSITDFLDQPEPRVLAIVGAPGSGKTTLLRHTARHICLDRDGRRRTVPILLYLRDHIAAITGNPRIGLADVLRGTLGRIGADEPPGWLEKRLEEGDCVVLLDGLDEVADLRDRRLVADWAERQIADHPRNDYVITSRPKGYRDAPLAGATVLQTRRFTDPQIATFVRSWYLAVERHIARPEGRDDEEVRRRAEQGADDLRARLRASPNLHELTVNPLLLTMIANVHRYRGALPGTRSDLYREICQVMLWRRTESKGLAVEPRGSQKELLLRHLAFEMMQRRVRDITAADCERILRPVLRRVPGELSAEDFLADAGSNGLVVERENGVFAFAHFTFQEYLAAEHILEKGPVRTLVRAVDDDWWRECTLLYAARADVDPIVEACLRSGTVTALALAFDCADEGRELGPELRARLDALLDASGTEDLERRRLMTAVTITRQLRSVIRTADGGRLCTTPVGAGTYELFRQETGAPPPDAPSGGDPNGPVLGVRARQARAFVQWVNELVRGESLYRLPTRAEITDPNAQSILYPAGSARHPESFWVTAAEQPERPVLWSPPDADASRALTAADVLAEARRDVDGAATVLAAVLALRAKASAAAALRLLDAVGDPDLDSAVARLPDAVSALDAAFAHGLIESLDTGFGLASAIAPDAHRVQKVAGELIDAEETAVLRILIRILAIDVAMDLSSLLGSGRATGVAELDTLKEPLRALERDTLRSRRRRNVPYQSVVSAGELLRYPASGNPEGLDENSAVLPLARARLDVQCLAVGPVLSWTADAMAASPDQPVKPFVVTAVDWPALADVLPHGSMMRIGSVAWEVERTALLTREALPTLDLSWTSGDDPSRAWLTELADATARTAAPWLARKSDAGREEVGRMRLSALCLAAESRIRGNRDLAVRWAAHAAAITWLQKRREGALPPVEAIVLASD